MRVHCSYDPATRGGDAPDNRKVKGTIHWVAANGAVPMRARLYDYLFGVDRPMDIPAGGSFLDNFAERSLEIVEGALGEPAVSGIKSGQSVQFERLGYFCADPDSTEGKPLFNRTVTLRDTWAKIEKKGS